MPSKRPMPGQRGIVSINTHTPNPNPSNGHALTDRDGEPENWFGPIAKGVLGKDAGYQLSKITGFPESSCYCWVSGSRRVQYLVVALLRSPQGGQWLSAFMYGSDVKWWRDFQRADALCEAARRYANSNEPNQLR